MTGAYRGRYVPGELPAPHGYWCRGQHTHAVIGNVMVPKLDKLCISKPLSIVADGTTNDWLWTGVNIQLDNPGT